MDGLLIYTHFTNNSLYLFVTKLLLLARMPVEGKLDCHGVTDDVVRAVVSVKQVIKQILRADWEACLIAASQHQSTTVAARIFTWLKQSDMALDHGERCTTAQQALYHALTRPPIGQNTCLVCKTQQAEISHLEHCDLLHTNCQL